MFHKPVSAEDFPDYHEVVKEPMDLTTIRDRIDFEAVAAEEKMKPKKNTPKTKSKGKKKVKRNGSSESKDETTNDTSVESDTTTPFPSHRYRFLEQFEHDISLLWSNCRTYNQNQDILGYCASVEAYTDKYYLKVKASISKAKEKAVKTREDAYREYMGDLKAPQALALHGPILNGKVSEAAYEASKEEITFRKYTLVNTYIPVVDKEIMIRKMSTSLKGCCDGTGCNNILTLGPFDDAKGKFVCDNADRKNNTECSDSCSCDPSKCMNREVSKGRQKVFQVSSSVAVSNDESVYTDVMKKAMDAKQYEVKEHVTFGFDPYTRRNIYLTLPNESALFYGATSAEEITSNDKEDFIMHVLSPALNRFVDDSVVVTPHLRAPFTLPEGETDPTLTTSLPAPEEPKVESDTKAETKAELDVEPKAKHNVESKAEPKVEPVEPKVEPKVEASVVSVPSEPQKDVNVMGVKGTEQSSDVVKLELKEVKEQKNGDTDTTIAANMTATTATTPVSSPVPSSNSSSQEEGDNTIPTSSSTKRSSSSKGRKLKPSWRSLKKKPSAKTVYNSWLSWFTSPSAVPASDRKREKQVASLVEKKKICPMLKTAYGIISESIAAGDRKTAVMAWCLAENILEAGEKEYRVLNKGYGMLCCAPDGFKKNEFLAEYSGEVYPPWRWYEKQDAVKNHYKKSKMPMLPEFYNIQLERPVEDEAGFDLLYIEPILKGNYVSRFSHSCNPNCATVLFKAGGRLVIGMFVIRDVKCGEELTFDYNSVTESADEYKNAVCLCGDQSCRGSFLYYGGSDTFQQVISDRHTFLDRTALLLRASTEPMSDEDRERCNRFGFKSSILSDLPEWGVRYVAQVLKYVEYERRVMPAELSQWNANHDLPASPEDVEDACEGIQLQRLQNLAIAMDKIKYVLRGSAHNGGDKLPPLHRLEADRIVVDLWSGEQSVMRELVDVMKPHIKGDAAATGVHKTLVDLLEKEVIPDGDEGPQRVRELFGEVRDLLRTLRPSTGAFYHAASDIAHLRSTTKHYFSCQNYDRVVGEPLELPDHPYKNGKGFPTVSGKKYSPQYIWGCLSYWMKQTIESPDSSLSANRRGTISLPSFSSCFSPKSGTPLNDKRRYDTLYRQQVLEHMEKRPWVEWPTRWHFKFQNKQRLYGSPWFDAALESEVGHEGGMLRLSQHVSGVVESLKQWQPSLPPDFDIHVEDQASSRKRKSSTNQ